MDRHTFLLQPGAWSGEGVVVDRSGGETKVTGDSRIEHAGRVWRIVAHVGAFDQVYAVEPFREAIHTKWRSRNPSLGELDGRFTIVGDTILSIFESIDRRSQGCELFAMIDGRHYENRGVLYVEGELVTAWELRLSRVELEPVSSAQDPSSE